jgi:LmbE family N-acetylglucosaminyl deacetylase
MASSRSNGRLPKFQRVLMVSAHPDDPDFGAGGSIARLADSGAEVTYVIVTDGRQGGEDTKQKDADLIAIRAREQRAAARVLGVKKVEFLGYKDGHLAPDLKLRRDIVRMIRKYRPELVITHIPPCLTPDGPHLITRGARRRWPPPTLTRELRARFALC